MGGDPRQPDLRRVQGPARVGAGGKERVAGAGGSVIMARAIGENARLEILQEAGHGVYGQDRDAFRALLLGFLTDHGLYEDS